MARKSSSLTLAVLAAASLASTFASPHISLHAVAPAPLYVPPAATHDLLNNSYIVMFHNDIPPSAFASHLEFFAYANEVHPLEEDRAARGIAHVYDSIVAKGYAGRFSEGVVEMIRRRPEVKYVEQDQIVRPDALQMNPPWGLARLNHRDQLYSNNMHYVSDDNGGNGVLVYVIDSGVQVEHVDFKGHAKWAASFFPDEGPVDNIGHGTHVAGIIGSATYGVAKHADIRAVKVFSSKAPGSNSIVIAAIQWAVQNALEYAAAHPVTFRGAVINMSLGSDHSQAVEDAADAAVRAGMHVVVAAGNNNGDACEKSPAAAQRVITVGATTIADAKAAFSNWGACVDVLAPGKGILSTWIGDTNRATRVLDGTSMAAPYVAGLAAYFLSIYPHPSFNPPCDLESGAQAGDLPPLTPKIAGLTPERLKKAILDLASSEKISGLDSETPNLIIFNNMTHEDIIPDRTKGLHHVLWSQNLDY